MFNMLKYHVRLCAKIPLRACIMQVPLKTNGSIRILPERKDKLDTLNTQQFTQIWQPGSLAFRSEVFCNVLVFPRSSAEVSTRSANPVPCSLLRPPRCQGSEIRTVVKHIQSNETQHMYIYVYIIIYIYICMYIYIYVYVYIHIYIFVCKYVYLYVYMYIYMYLCKMYVYMYICIYICIHIYVNR